MTEFILHSPYIKVFSLSETGIGLRRTTWVGTFLLRGNTDIDAAAKVEAGDVDAFPGDASGHKGDAHSEHYGGKKGVRYHILTLNKNVE